MARARLRDLGITIGCYPTGPLNAITDVPGVLVGHCTIVRDEPRIARTGVTIIMPRDGDIYRDSAFAGFHSFNGCGEMTGIEWIEESGLLSSPIALTNTNQVGLARDAIVRYGADLYGGHAYKLPVAAETWDGWLSDADAFHLTTEDVLYALRTAAAGPVAEGNVGGGTGMICHDFKGGIGTSSRVVDTGAGQYTLGVLVQANHGTRAGLRLEGVPVGRHLSCAKIPSPWQHTPPLSSLLVIIATDAPIIATQCSRLARRATLGMARVGAWGGSWSGDLFLAFATGNHIHRETQGPHSIQMLPHAALNPLFEAEAEAVEEAIWNALTGAETMSGFQGRIAHAVPLDELQHLWAQYQPAR